MKKLAIAMMLGVASVSANAQISSMQPAGRKDIRHSKTAQQFHDGKSDGCR